MGILAGVAGVASLASPVLRPLAEQALTCSIQSSVLGGPYQICGVCPLFGVLIGAVGLLELQWCTNGYHSRRAVPSWRSGSDGEVYGRSSPMASPRGDMSLSSG
eukprot:5397162-Pyramimonas_sp.AAC.1